MKDQLTQADEEKKINFEIYVFRRRMFKMNKELKYFQVTGVDITYSEQMLAPIKLHWQFWKRIKEWNLKRKFKQTDLKNKEM